MAYTTPAGWADGSGGATPITAAALNLRDANVADHQARLIALEGADPPTAAIRSYASQSAAEAGLAANEFADGALIIITS